MQHETQTRMWKLWAGGACLPSAVLFCNKEAQQLRSRNALGRVAVSPWRLKPNEYEKWELALLSCLLVSPGAGVCLRCAAARRASAAERRRRVCAEERSAAHRWWAATSVGHGPFSRPYSRPYGCPAVAYIHEPSFHCAAVYLLMQSATFSPIFKKGNNVSLTKQKWWNTQIKHSNKY